MTSAPPTDPAGHAAVVVGRWAQVLERVAAAAVVAGREPGDVAVLLAAKTVPVDVLRAVALAGGTLLGHNRVQELTATAPALADLPVVWHVIGPLQSNKVNAALRWATCAQSVDSADLAERLARRCAATGREVDVMVQVNVSAEATKSGVSPAAAVELAVRVAGLDGLRLVGLMTVGARSQDAGLVRAGYARLRHLRDEVLASGSPGTGTATGLSMGMSGDLELAIAEGATLVRLGSAVFGPRPAP